MGGNGVGSSLFGVDEIEIVVGSAIVARDGRIGRERGCEAGLLPLAVAPFGVARVRGDAARP